MARRAKTVPRRRPTFVPPRLCGSIKIPRLELVSISVHQWFHLLEIRLARQSLGDGGIPNAEIRNKSEFRPLGYWSTFAIFAFPAAKSFCEGVTTKTP
jgi:hypothetical protein